MNNKRLITWVQNLLLLFLSVNAVFLLSRTALFSELSRAELAQRFGTGLSATANAVGSDSESLAAFSVPLRIVQSSDLVCRGEDSLTTSGETFEQVGTFLGEAIGSAHSMQTVHEADFLHALGESGLYFDFPGALPLELLAARLGVSPSTTQALDIRRCLVNVGSGETALLYLYTDSGVCLCCSTEVNSASVKSHLDTVVGNGSAFAVRLGSEYEALSPFTLILGEANGRPELASANALSDFSTEELLRRLEFNAHTKDRYTESNGTLVVLEGQRMLRLEPGGTVIYSGEPLGDPGSAYTIDTAEGTLPTRPDCAAAAQTLLSSVLAERIGEARIYLHSAQTVPGGYRLFFDYMVNGTPILFSDGSHAAEVVTEGDAITALTLRLRRYSSNGEECLLLPLPQAAAIGGLYEQSELSVAYIDTFSDVTHAEWIAD